MQLTCAAKHSGSDLRTVELSPLGHEEQRD